MIHEIVIVGGGFAGIRVAKTLSQWGRDIHITLIDKSRYHVFHPALYKIATAHILEPFRERFSDFSELRSSAVYSLEEIFLNSLNVTFIEDEVTGINSRDKTILLKNSPLHRYDILVLAIGSETEYFDIPGLRGSGLSIKSVMEALTVRDAVDEAFARLPKHHQISVVIGGGGFTGCELAAAMTGGYLRNLAHIHGRSAKNVECVIVEASEVLLGGASVWSQKKTMLRLKRLGVRVLLASPIAEVDVKSVILKNGERIFYDVLVWTAGVSICHMLRETDGLHTNKRGQVVVDKNLRAKSYHDIFVVGDAACVVDPISGANVPMTASNALHEATYVAENIKRSISKQPLKTFVPSSTSFIIPLGGRYALFESRVLRVSGIVPWILKQLVEFYYWWTIVGLRKAWMIRKKGATMFIKNG